LFSPIYGKVAVMGGKIINFDIYAAFGMGMTQTSECLECLDADEEIVATKNTANQLHPTTNFGGGARVIFNENLAFRLEGRSMVYIETVNSTQLEMKNNFIIQSAVSIFFPAIK
jgi:outer membrane beta-barrel protein